MMKRIIFLLLFTAPAAAQLPNRISVKDYGAKAVLGTDDTPAITAAINAAIARPQYLGETVVYFPPPGYYDIKTPLVLPASPKRITLYFDSPLYIEATITIHGGYTLHGTESANAAFDPIGGTPFSTGYNVNPAIHIQGVGINLENIFLGYIHDQSDGIVIDGSSNIRLKNTGVIMVASNVKGTALKIGGGFSYDIDGGGYNSYGAMPSIQFNDDTVNCNDVGIIRISNLTLAGNGIQFHNHCGNSGAITIDRVLYESGSHPFLTAIVDGGSPIFGVQILNSNIADSWGTPLPPLINVQAPNGTGTKGFVLGSVTIVNSYTDGVALTTGGPIYDLEVWSSREYSPAVIAQKDHFIYHGPSGIKDTMPRIP